MDCVEKWSGASIHNGAPEESFTSPPEPRVTIGIPIIGCPDYMALMRPRAASRSLAVASPHFPPSLLASITAHDPSSARFSSSDPAQNPFLGKHILVLSGGKDKLVPWLASRKFVEELQVGDGTKRVIIDENAAHECTRRMVSELASFVYEYGVAVKATRM